MIPDETSNAIHDRQQCLIDEAWRQIESADRSAGTIPASYEVTENLPTSTHGSAFAVPRVTGYRILSEIHRGGQGIVYRAIQESTGMTVAIKVMVGGRLVTPQQAARFEREVRILARMRHPNIVTIHDRGAVEGIAYFVMDFIDGDPLDDYLHREDRTAEKLRLFASICRAVNAAHLHGVMHRDLKPRNVLVDSRGEPHILDFGLAKSIHESDGEDETMTQTGQFVGSLPWSSPEQATAQTDQIDIRTDVYSLGVILYQILTGTFPYPVRGKYSDVVHAIAHQQPRGLGRDVDHDIATVALMAIEKDPARRYQTAGALGQDVERFLAGEPIDAKRSSTLYLLRRKLIRHKWIALLLATLLVSLIGGLVVSTSLWRIATLRAREASRAAATSDAVTQFLSRTLQSADPGAGGESAMTVQQAIQQATAELDQGSLAAEPEVEGTLRMIIGKTYSSLGMPALGRAQLERALEVLGDSARGESRLLPGIYAELAGTLRSEGRLDEAQKIGEQALADVRKQPDPNPIVVGDLLHGLAAIARDRGQYERSERQLKEALRATRNSGDGADAVAKAEAAAILLNELAITLALMERHDEALNKQKEAVELFKQVVGDHHYRTAVAISNLAGEYREQGDFESAETHYQQAIRIFHKTVGKQHPAVASCLDAMGSMYRQQKKHALARDAFEQALEIRQAVLPDGHALLGYSLNSLALCAYDAGDFQHAADYFSRALEIIKSERGEEHPVIASVLSNTAGAEFARGHYQRAIKLLRDALAINVKCFGDDHIKTVDARFNLGKTLTDAGDPTEAATLLRSALEARIAEHGENHASVASAQLALGNATRMQGKWDEAERLTGQALETFRRLEGESLSVALALTDMAAIRSYRGDHQAAKLQLTDAIAMATQTLPDGHWQLARLRGKRGVEMVHLGEYEQGLAECTDAHHVLMEKLSAQHPHSRELAKQLTELLATSDRPDLVAQWERQVRHSHAPPKTDHDR